MNIHHLKLPFDCPDCGVTTEATLAELETGHFSCMACLTRHSFDKALATKTRDEIERNLQKIIEGYYLPVHTPINKENN